MNIEWEDTQVAPSIDQNVTNDHFSLFIEGVSVHTECNVFIEGAAGNMWVLSTSELVHLWRNLSLHNILCSTFSPN